MRFNLSTSYDIHALADLLRDAEQDPRIIRWMLWPFGRRGAHIAHLPVLDRRRAVVVLVRATHRKHKQKNLAALAKIRLEWQAVEPEFIRLRQRLFGQDRLTKTPIAYGTVLGIYPRDLFRSTFSVPLRHRKRNFAVGVIAHELLHFYFYKRYRRTYPSVREPKKNLRVWHASELFNAVVQSSPAWRHLFPTMPYPEHRAFLPKLRKVWKEENDAGPLIRACNREARRFINQRRIHKDPKARRRKPAPNRI